MVTFTTRVVAEVFFDRSPDWLRWREKQGLLVRPDGTPIVTRTPVQHQRGGGDRRYTLEDIEQIAHSLMRAAVLDKTNVERVLARVQAQRAPIEVGGSARATS